MNLFDLADKRFASQSLFMTVKVRPSARKEQTRSQNA
jgi:hypothetical protein